MEFVTIDVLDGFRPIQVVCQDVITAMRLRKFIEEAQDLMINDSENNLIGLED